MISLSFDGSVIRWKRHSMEPRPLDYCVDFGLTRERYQKASEWHQQNQNPTQIGTNGATCPDARTPSNDDAFMYRIFMIFVPFESA